MGFVSYKINLLLQTCKIQVALLRGKYLNKFETKNLVFTTKENIGITGVSSLHPIHTTFSFSTIKLFSLIDLLDNKPARFIANRTIGDLQILFGLEKILPSFDIVHTADPHYYFSYQAAILRKKELIPKLISTCWETIPFNNESTWVKKKIKKLAMKHTDYFICPTKRAKRALEKEGISSDKITVIPMGVNINKFCKKKNKHIKTILFVGRLVEEKGILDLYEVYKKINNSNLRLLIVGSGVLGNKLKQLIINDKLQKQVFIERSSYKEMPNVYNEADLVVVPSKTTKTWEEQFGMVAVEAMASGLPVIAYHSGALQEVIGKAGVLIEEGDEKGLVSAISRILNDDKLALRLGTIARERAENLYDCSKVKNQYKKLYESFCSGIDQK